MKKSILSVMLSILFLNAGELNEAQRTEFKELIKEGEYYEQNYKILEKADPKTSATLEQYYTINVSKLLKLSIEADDENAFKMALQKASMFDLNELPSIIGDYDFSKDIVAKNRLNLLNELTNFNFDFKLAKLSLYAKSISAEPKMIERLQELER